jgi:hypothetical protein
MRELHGMLSLLQVQLQLRLGLLKLHRSLLHVHELLHVRLLGLVWIRQTGSLLHGPSNVLGFDLAHDLLHGVDNCPAAHAQHAGHGGRPCCPLLCCAIRQTGSLSR